LLSFLIFTSKRYSGSLYGMIFTANISKGDPLFLEQRRTIEWHPSPIFSSSSNFSVNNSCYEMGRKISYLLEIWVEDELVVMSLRDSVLKLLKNLDLLLANSLLKNVEGVAFADSSVDSQSLMDSISWESRL